MNAKKTTRIEKPALKKTDGRAKNGGARPNAGRKPFSPTATERKQVESMSGFGVPLDQIAALIREGISVDTLTKYFERELISGKAKANSKVGQTLFQKATSGDTTAAIWWSKTQMRWAEVHRLEHTSPDGTMTPSFDVSKLSDTALAEILAAKNESE